MEKLLFPLLIAIVGALFLIRNISHIRNEQRLREYLANSPKAKLWVNKFGMEKTVELSKKYFLPLGIVISCLMLGVGTWSVITLLTTSA